MTEHTSHTARRLWNWNVANVWLVQSLYYAVTGVWPLIEIRSFQAVTGPKTDLWLVKTVGVAVASIGAAIGVAGGRGRITPEIVQLATSSALSLAGVDSYYALRGRISKVYLVDAAVNVIFSIAWLLRQRSESTLDPRLPDGVTPVQKGEMRQHHPVDIEAP